MLTALEQGVKGGVWVSLIDKVYAERTLRTAWQHVKANGGAAGVDHVTVAMYERDLDRHLATLATPLRDGSYRPQPIRRTWIDKPGSREPRRLGIPTVRDRVVQTAVRLVLEPIVERNFAAQSYGFRPGRGCKDALRRVDSLLTAGSTWIVDTDLRPYFDTIPQAALMQRIRGKVADGRVLALLEAFLTQAVMDGLSTWTPDEGTPQGAVIRPLLANIYLDPLDHHLAAGIEIVRDADDLVLLCRTAAEAQHARTALGVWTQAAGLTLHPEKTRIVDATQRGGFDFLGDHFDRGRHWLRAKSVKRLKDTLRAKTARTRGQSLAVIIDDVNRTLRGWLVSAQSAAHLASPGRMGAATAAQRPAQTSPSLWPWTRTTRSSALAQRIPCDAWALSPHRSPGTRLSVRTAVNHQPESRMRETRLSGSEGGGGELNHFSLPLSLRSSSFLRFSVLNPFLRNLRCLGSAQMRNLT
jgi:RNA-directed DNA polymerase